MCGHSRRIIIIIIFSFFFIYYLLRALVGRDSHFLLLLLYSLGTTSERVVRGWWHITHDFVQSSWINFSKSIALSRAYKREHKPLSLFYALSRRCLCDWLTKERCFYDLFSNKKNVKNITFWLLILRMVIVLIGMYSFEYTALNEKSSHQIESR